MKSHKLLEEVREETWQKRLVPRPVARLIDGAARKLAYRLFKHGYLSEVVDVDTLTGLYNRNFYERWMKIITAQALRAGVGLVIVMVDVDGLKKTNDSLGHAAGDKMIKTIAKLFLRSVRQSDVVMRLGGDEFLLVFWDGDEEGVKEKMAEVKEKAGELGISFSYGVAEVQRGFGLKRKLAEADEKMYLMKRQTKRQRRG